MNVVEEGASPDKENENRYLNHVKWECQD